MRADATAITTEGLTKFYGAVRGVEGLDLDVHQGEIYGFLGPNGAGKTTTLRLLLDLIRPDRGSASVLGLDVRRERVTLHREIGYLPGEFVVWPELTGRENLAYLGRLRGGVPEAAVAALAERLELDLGKKFHTYSHGNKQKLGLIQAFMHRPRLLLLDEPTGGLDPLVQNTFAEMLDDVRDEGRTVFLSSHVLSEVERTCDRVGIIREGTLVEVARVSELGMGGTHLVRMTFAQAIDPAPFRRVPGVGGVVVESGDRLVTATAQGEPKPLLELALTYPLLEFESRRPSLEELFLHLYGATDAGGAGVDGSTEGGPGLSTPLLDPDAAEQPRV